MCLSYQHVLQLFTVLITPVTLLKQVKTVSKLCKTKMEPFFYFDMKFELIDSINAEKVLYQ